MRKDPYKIELDSCLYLKQVDAQFVEAIVKEAKGNMTLASLWLGISRGKIYRILKQNGLTAQKLGPPKKTVVKKASDIKVVVKIDGVKEIKPTTLPAMLSVNTLPKGYGF